MVDGRPGEIHTSEGEGLICSLDLGSKAAALLGSGVGMDEG